MQILGFLALRRIRAAAPILAAALLVSACGGGGGGPSSEPPQAATPAPPPDCVQTAEFGCVSPPRYLSERQTIEAGYSGEEDFKNQWGLTAIRADRAYAQLELLHGAGSQPGSGQTTGLIDSGIDTGHPVFAGKRVTERFLNGATDETGDELSHGTAVASVIAGHPSAAFTAAVTAARGVAWGADIAMFAIPLGTGVPDYNPVSLTGLARADDRWAPRIDDVTGWSSGGRSLDFVNVSVGIEGIVEQYPTQQIRTNLADMIAALAQTGASEKTVFVWAAGNGHGDPCDAADFTDNPDLCVNGRVVAKSVDILPGLQARIAELRGHAIAVVAVAPDSDGDGDYEIAAFSNRCGIAADWCLAAPGAGVKAAYFGPDPDDDSPGVQGAYTGGGTSFAAPMVTGGLAVMKHYFRSQLSNTDLVARMMATADKTGIYADSSIYGQGLLDLGAATTPVGVASVALGERVDGLGDNLAQTRFALGGALGDGLARALAGHEIAAFDTLGAPFWFPLGDLAGAAPGPSAAARLRDFTAPRQDRETGVLRPRYASLAGGDRLSLGIMQAPVTDGGHLALAGRALTLGSARDGLSVAAFSTEGLSGQNPASGATLSWRPDGSPLGLTGGWIAERETVLGSSAAGAFGRLSGSSAFAGIEGNARIGSWRLGAGAEIGTVRAAAQGGMLASISPLTTSAFAVAAARKLAGGNGLRFSLAQPLRVEAGRARLTVPAGRTQDGRVLRRQFAAGLAPSGRQIDIAAEWHRSLADGGELRLGAGLTRQPGHDAAADPELTLLAGWRYAF